MVHSRRDDRGSRPTERSRGDGRRTRCRQRRAPNNAMSRSVHQATYWRRSSAYGVAGQAAVAGQEPDQREFLLRSEQHGSHRHRGRRECRSLPCRYLQHQLGPDSQDRSTSPSPIRKHRRYGDRRAEALPIGHSERPNGDSRRTFRYRRHAHTGLMHDDSASNSGSVGAHGRLGVRRRRSQLAGATAESGR